MNPSFIGNNRSKEIHLPSCFCLRQINKGNIVPFNSLQEALQEGYNGCGHCLTEYNNYSWTPTSPLQESIISPEKIQHEKLITGFSITKKNEPWDILILGAGPTGLSALKEALNIKEEFGHSLNILVIEKENKCGADRRAETINSTKTLDEIWGEGFLNNITIDRHQKNVLYAPHAKHSATVTMIEAPHSFHWRGDNNHPGLIDSMENILALNNATKIKSPTPQMLQLSSEAFIAMNVEARTIPINTSWPTTTPVPFVETSAGPVYGKTILDCTGFSTNIGRQLQQYTSTTALLEGFNLSEIYGNAYEMIVNPIVKSCWKNNYPTAQYPDFQSFFIPRNVNKSIGNSPPGMVVIFPYGNGNAEINFQLFDELGSVKQSNWEETLQLTQQLWEYLKGNYPVLSEIMKHFKNNDKEYEEITGMPSVGMISPPMPIPGIALVGDSGGQVNPKSSSGLETSLLAAKFWVHTAWQVSMNKQVWSSELKDRYNYTFMNTYLANDDRYKKSFFQDLVDKHIEVNRNKILIFSLLNWGGNADSENWFHWAITLLGYNSLEKKDALNISLSQYQQFDTYQQSAIINAILGGAVVFNKAEKSILLFLQSTKDKNPEQWNKFLELININKLYEKFQGQELSQLLKLLGPLATVECAIQKGSKWIILREIDSNTLKETSLQQRGLLAKILIESPPPSVIKARQCC